MKNYISIFQLILSIFLIILILIQNKGTGFGRVWGGTTSFTRRGLEKFIFKITFVISAIFIIISILQLTL
jgi:protein translocase SecG subunit